MAVLAQRGPGMTVCIAPARGACTYFAGPLPAVGSSHAAGRSTRPPQDIRPTMSTGLDPAVAGAHLRVVATRSLLRTSAVSLFRTYAVPYRDTLRGTLLRLLHW